MYGSIKAYIKNVCLSNNHSCGSFYYHTVYRINVVNAIRSLCAGKSDGVDDICTDNLKHETDRFLIILSLYLIVYCRLDVYLSAFFHLPKYPYPKIQDWTLTTQRTTELLHLVVCLATLLIKLLLRNKLNSLAHWNYNFATKIKALL